MTKKMLIDATHAEETRVVVVDGTRVEEFDFESLNKRQLAGNIYLAKVTRVEPSLQAAFVEYGGNRHGFLAFSEIHPDYYQIPVADRRALIEAEERENAEAEAQRAAADRDRASRAEEHPAESVAEAPAPNGDEPPATDDAAEAAPSSEAEPASAGGSEPADDAVEVESDQQVESVGADAPPLRSASPVSGVVVSALLQAATVTPSAKTNAARIIVRPSRVLQSAR